MVTLAISGCYTCNYHLLHLPLIVVTLTISTCYTRNEQLFHLQWAVLRRRNVAVIHREMYFPSVHEPIFVSPKLDGLVPTARLRQAVPSPSSVWPNLMRPRVCHGAASSSLRLSEPPLIDVDREMERRRCCQINRRRTWDNETAGGAASLENDGDTLIWRSVKMRRCLLPTEDRCSKTCWHLF